MPVEEPDKTPTDEVIDPPDPANGDDPGGDPPEIEKPDPAKVRDEALAKLPDALREAFGGEYDEDELAAVSEGITADRLKAHPPAVRATLRAMLARDAAAEKARAEKDVADKAEIAKQRAALDEQAKALRTREAALLALARGDAAADPGKAPEADPFTPEGQRALATYEAKKGVAAALAPLRAEAARVDTNQRWLALVEKYPDLRDEKTAKEFDDYVKAANEGIDPTKERPRLATPLAAQVFFGQREAERLKRELAEKRTREAADRAEGARAIGRATSGSAPNPLERWKQIKRSNPENAYAILESDPELRAAVREHLRQSA